MLLRLAYLAVTNTFAVLRLLPMSNRDKDLEILLALRHQITVLERQLGKEKVQFDASDRAFLAAVLHRLPRDVPCRVRLLVRPDTVRWHRDLLARRRAAVSRSKRPGPAAHCAVRPHAGTASGTRESNWGYRRLHGELLVLGVEVAASTVWEISKDAGTDPAPERAASTRADFLRSQADALLACDFLETVTLTGARIYVLAAIEHASRRIHILGATPHPSTAWVVQAAKNLVMDLENTSSRVRYMIRDRDGRFPEMFDAVLTDAGIDIVLSGIQMPSMNSIMERWVQTCRRELLDRTLIWKPAAPAPRPTRVRTVLQRASPTPGHREHPPAPLTTRTIADPRQDHPPRRTKT